MSQKNKLKLSQSASPSPKIFSKSSPSTSPSQGILQILLLSASPEFFDFDFWLRLESPSFQIWVKDSLERVKTRVQRVQKLTQPFAGLQVHVWNKMAEFFGLLFTISECDQLFDQHSF